MQYLWVLALLLAPSTDVDQMLRSGLIALGSGDLQRAEEQLGQAAKLQPGDARIWLALAQTRWKLNKSGADAAAKARNLGATDPVVLGGLALFYTQTGDAKSAVEVAKAALNYRDDARIRNLLGKAYEAQGAHADAVRELTTAVRLSPYEESFYFDLVQSHLVHQEFTPALEVLDSSRKVFARSPQLELARGVAYYGQRRFAEAADAFLKTIDIAPDVPQPYLFLSRILDHAEERAGEVLVRFRKLADSKPDDAGAQFLLGQGTCIWRSRQERCRSGAPPLDHVERQILGVALRTRAAARRTAEICRSRETIRAQH